MSRFLSVLTALTVAACGTFAASPAEAAAKNHTVFSYSGYGDYKGGLRNVRTDRAAKVKVSANCDGSSYNFVNVSWNGKPRYDYDSYWLDIRGDSGRGSSNLYPDEKRGYFEVSTQSDCRVSVKITQRY